MNPNRVTIPAILERKKSARKITALTAYDYAFARVLNLTEIDLVLVGDSLGMVALGYETTLPVTMDEMIPKVEKYFGGLKRKPEPTRYYGQEPLPSGEKRLIYRDNKLSPRIELRYQIPGVGHPARLYYVQGHIAEEPESYHVQVPIYFSA